MWVWTPGGGVQAGSGKDYALWDHSSDTTCGIIHSRIGSSQDWEEVQRAGADSDKGEEQSSHNLIVGFIILCLGSFILLSILGYLPACAAHFVHFDANRAVTETMQGRMKTKEGFTISAKYYNRLATVFHILYFPPLHLSLHYTHPPLVLSKCRLSVGGQETFSSRSARSPIPLILSFVDFCLLEQEDEWRVRG